MILFCHWRHGTGIIDSGRMCLHIQSISIQSLCIHFQQFHRRYFTRYIDALRRDGNEISGTTNTRRKHDKKNNQPTANIKSKKIQLTHLQDTRGIDFECRHSSRVQIQWIWTNPVPYPMSTVEPTENSRDNCSMNTSLADSSPQTTESNANKRTGTCWNREQSASVDCEGNAEAEFEPDYFHQQENEPDFCWNSVNRDARWSATRIHKIFAWLNPWESIDYFGLWLNPWLNHDFPWLISIHEISTGKKQRPKRSRRFATGATFWFLHELMGWRMKTLIFIFCLSYSNWLKTFWLNLYWLDAV